MPGPGRRFQPGQSGNPNGRPKVVAEVRELAREHTGMAVGTLVEIATDKEQDARARVAAANSLLDRGFGRPMQGIELDASVHKQGATTIRLITPMTRMMSVESKD